MTPSLKKDFQLGYDINVTYITLETRRKEQRIQRNKMLYDTDILRNYFDLRLVFRKTFVR